MSGFSNFFGGIADGVRAARLYNQLDRMSDRRLADIGLSREDLPRKASEWSSRR
ncbi:DUF1127 domain-containing protein [Bauldia sp.]|uniref:DUF1127 domain-containing protein n=1 Tax=Bauldia sp. TaxID=2575872 RepID=UPI003BAAB5C6